MRISQLEFFVSAAQNRSFSKAAKECFTVQSAVSQQITALEDELGFLLFERTSKGIELTPAGERYYADTVVLLRQLQDNQRAASQIAHGINGSLKVGIAGANQAAFMGSLKRFYQDNPALSVQFLDVSTEHQVDELKNGVYDILYTAVFNMRGLEKEVAFAEKRSSVLAVYMNAEHPLAKQKNIRLEELARWTNLYAGIPENGKASSTERDIFDGSGIQPVRTLYVRNQNISSLLLDFNIGVAVAPEELLRSMPRGIERRSLESGRYKIDLGWAYLRENNNPALLRLLSYFRHLDS